MVDRVYVGDLPRLREALSMLRSEFNKTDRSTPWVRLRVDPLLKHVRELESLVPLIGPSGVRGVVPMLHSDLTYLRENVRRLKRTLAAQRPRAGRRRTSS